MALAADARIGQRWHGQSFACLESAGTSAKSMTMATSPAVLADS